MGGRERQSKERNLETEKEVDQGRCTEMETQKQRGECDSETQAHRHRHTDMEMQTERRGRHGRKCHSSWGMKQEPSWKR